MQIDAEEVKDIDLVRRSSAFKLTSIKNLYL
jgi:hypothetical protein